MMVRRILTEWFVLLLCLAGLAVLAARFELTNPVDARLLDRAASTARADVSDDILIVAIDDASLAELGPWPWPRSTHARLLDAIAEMDSGVVLYDVLFLEPTQPEEDAALGNAVGRHGNVILPFTFLHQINTQDGIVPAYPIDSIAHGAAGLGHVTINPDPDGVLRRFNFDLTIDGQNYPHFVETALGVDEGSALDLPAEPLIAFHPVNSYARIPAADVIAGRVPQEFLQDKTVLVGATAQGMGDRYSVGAREIAVMPGVETQANLLDAARSGSLVAAQSSWWSAALGVLALALLFWVFWKLSPRAGLIATVAISLSIIAIVTVLIPLAGIWIAPGAALLAVLLAYPFWSWRRLTSVSAYLEEEAAFLRPEGAQKAKVDGFDQIARQVSRMRRLVSNVSRSFQFMQKVIEAAPDAILVLDKAGLVVMANRKAKQLFPDWEEDRPEPIEDLLEESLAQRARRKDDLVFPDGRTFLVARADFEIEKAEEGGEIVALRDVSASRRRDEERREMLEFLSHDMRSPQVAIIGLSRRMGESNGAADIPLRIRNQAERTLKLADDFVQLARLEEAELEFEDTDVAALVEEACDRAYTSALQKRIAVHPVVPEEPLFATIDASLLARLLDNLIGNAIKFAPEDSGVEIELTEATDTSIRLSVCDEGPGLPPERLKNPFARFGAHETKAGPSVGLGLTFVKRVVDKHAGKITVESAAGSGTCFVITLPSDGPVAE
ncbi:CHASE2 and HATPase_c domain-containing protein [Aurantiacibacter sp. D1-12]|uniref:CHASE2 and HATPase_c domain-containing protein n=1 Tax=Aurantiacibacter sp. D1-12 TaxID=2993658 RepID=UPI00237CAD92|nr:CHASE2 and HATPase_c domain-containing protein [Aurantiacibacter sp. D1-12]MDE1467778.1 CHASE2 and HATPase_c domain-containing protein [Aurantiacibacter sp. D1-12]